MNDRRRQWIVRLGGVAVGVAIFVGVNVGTGRAIVPSVASITRTTLALTPGDLATIAAAPAPALGAYQACSVCHQPEGQGIPFAFPPLAGSPWMTGDPETPIRIVLLGLSGPIEVNGASFNLVMPPPPVIDDAQIAEAITYARTHFGNEASAVSVEQVKAVRASLAGRTTPFTAAELVALRAGAKSANDAAHR